GLRTVYELDRVAGRYNAVADERTQPHTAYELGRSKPVDLFSMARRRLLGPLVDAEYGSATFVAATRPAIFEVRGSTTGLLERRAERRREQRIVTTDDPAALERPRPAIGGAGIALDLERAVAALPPGAREVFVLHDVEGYRHEEIAQLTGIAVGTSKAQLFRARRLLREALNR